MAHTAPFLATLAPAERAAVVEEAVGALRDAPPLERRVLLLVARV
jgi:hypothetical protein